MLTESAVLSLAGGTLGVTLASLALPAVASLAPVTIPGLSRLEIDRTVLAFAGALSLFTGLLFGLIPAVRATSARLRAGLATDSRGSVGSGSHKALSPTPWRSAHVKLACEWRSGRRRLTS